MKHIGLMFAMEAEMKFFASKLQDLQQKTIHKRTFYTGAIDNKVITAVVSGMGKVVVGIDIFQKTAFFKKTNAGSRS